MRLTTMGRYGARAIFDIAYYATGLPVKVQDIAKRQQLPIRYLEHILNKLKKSDFIRGTRGPGGGYVLAKDPHLISVGDIFQAVREEMDIVPCICKPGETAMQCRRQDQCVTISVWREASQHLKNYFNSVTIADLCEDARRKSLKSKGNDNTDKKRLDK